MRHLLHSEQEGRAPCGISLRIALVAAWTIHAVCSSSLMLSANDMTPTLTPHHVAIYALSRGKGVPETARRVLQDVRALAETGKQQGTVQEWGQTRIGLEGETRVCVQLRDESSKHEFLRQVREMVQGAELINVVEGPCSQP